ncbi:hypothetical protein [Paraflavitalea sp. CAU 1676]|uniref:hypothetical protein n=1 Tax=Paraflavitalea sp. CAU 1676 TaxID=3032598 RepID=UPI0023DAC856|nr:hypothetical protein [Paraflavitalea sp. CAU 1676]MDF2193458.1 hypothetical protein [Paraflavitalea sp. CAU 1676]
MSFFKSLFTNKPIKDNFPIEVSAEFPQYVKKAIQLLGEQGVLENEAVFELFTANGIPGKEATEIFLFLPIAFVRHLLPDFNWKDSYLEFYSKKKQIERKYSETKAYLIIHEVTQQYFQNSPVKETVFKIAGRSSEFDAINQFLHNGGKLEDGELSLTVIMR